jgi:phosphoglycerol transferase MdoB-like AlkP superfamily enzyme
VLRKQSLYFNNFYATGTRTDRGKPSPCRSRPPGRSIVKRIGRESGYASLGQQLAAVGYDAVFVYGGRGYFDNMNAFFSGNGYRIVDQSSVDEAKSASRTPGAWPTKTCIARRSSWPMPTTPRKSRSSCN